jgi:hypothetical protein
MSAFSENQPKRAEAAAAAAAAARVFIWEASYIEPVQVKVVEANTQQQTWS